MNTSLNAFVKEAERVLGISCVGEIQKTEFGFSNVDAYILGDRSFPQWILRIFRPSPDGVIATPEAIELTQRALFSRGFPVPEPIGVFTLDGIQASVEAFVPGSHRLKPTDHDALKIVRLIAQLHRLTCHEGEFTDDAFSHRWDRRFSAIAALLEPYSCNGAMTPSCTHALETQLIQTAHKSLTDANALRTKVARFVNMLAENCLLDRIEGYIDLYNRRIRTTNDLYISAVHGDVSPKNVLFKTDGEISALIDFGSLRCTYALHDLTSTITTWNYCMGQSTRLNGESTRRLVKKLVLEYHNERPLTEAEIGMCPVFVVTRFLEYVVDFSWMFLSGLRGDAHPRMLFQDPIEVFFLLELYAKDAEDPDFHKMFNPYDSTYSDT